MATKQAWKLRPTSTYLEKSLSLDLVPYKHGIEKITELCLSWQCSRIRLANESAKRFCLTGCHLVHCVLQCCAVLFLPLTELLCCTEPYLLISARLRLPGLHIKMALCLIPFSQVLCASDLSFQGHITPLLLLTLFVFSWELKSRGPSFLSR